MLQLFSVISAKFLSKCVEMVSLTGFCIIMILQLVANGEMKPIETAPKDVSTHKEPGIGTTTTDGPVKRSTTEAVPTIDRNHVTLALPDELFSSTANLTLRLRDVVGQLIMSSTARFAKLLRFVQPLFGNSLVIEIPKDLQ
ncbi:uncharacterized protein LOC131677948 [Topomyia yanbarensis]|uniref:uncharacterized protein LOC131677948 n=1 Tax=Topomyia yanbarensis TaxID=2498891 RepID=UPI00273ABEB2|nr:uncharacterized protein LOC131677948 [Topomyia yanbarensis]